MKLEARTTSNAEVSAQYGVGNYRYTVENDRTCSSIRVLVHADPAVASCLGVGCVNDQGVRNVVPWRGLSSRCISHPGGTHGQRSCEGLRHEPRR